MLSISLRGSENLLDILRMNGGLRGRISHPENSRVRQMRCERVDGEFRLRIAVNP